MLSLICYIAAFGCFLLDLWEKNLTDQQLGMLVLGLMFISAGLALGGVGWPVVRNRNQ